MEKEKEGEKGVEKVAAKPHHAARSSKKTKEAPKKRGKKNYTLLWALGILIVIVVIILLIRGCGKEEAAPTEVTKPTEVTPIEKEKPSVTGLADEPYCKEGAAIGAKPGFCKDLQGNVEITLTHLGADTLSGIKYMTYDELMNKLNEDIIMEQISGKSEKTFTLKVDKDTKKLEVRAIANIDGVDKVCTNQRILVPLRNC